MRRLKPKEKIDLEREISKHFSIFEFEVAPKTRQGQNPFSLNYSLRNKEGEFLLKIVFLEKLQEVTDPKKALAEINICKKLKSSYTAPIEEVKITKKYGFILFPFLEGETIAEYIKDDDGAIKNLSEESIKKIAIGILSGIVDIWQGLKITHQDIKPENIFIERENDVKILDFGAARFGKSSFKGRAVSNFAFSSTEQIFTSPPHSIHGQHRIIDDRSDVFSAGLIIYQLIAGKHPYGNERTPAIAISKGLPIPLIERSDISSGIKEIVYAMLQYNNANRPHAISILKSFEKGSLIMPGVNKERLYYIASNGTNRLKELIERLEEQKEYEPSFEGIIFNSTQVPKNANNFAKLRRLMKDVIIDPQCYLFQKPTRIGKSFRELPYYDIGYNPQEDGIFTDFIKDGAKRENLIKKVVDFEIGSGASALVPPFLYIEDFKSDAWVLDQEITESSIDLIKKEALPLPIIKGVALYHGVLTSPARENIIEYLTSLEDVDGFMVLLSSSHSEVIIDESWLSSARDFFAKLSATGKPVIWAKADISGLVMAHPGLSIAMNESLSGGRKFDIDSPLQKGGRAGKFLYIPKLFARAKWKDGVSVLQKYKRYEDFVCGDVCCEEFDFRELGTREIKDLAIHMLYQFSKIFHFYSGEGGRKKAKNDVSVAWNHFKNLSESKDFLIKEALKKEDIKPNNGSFLKSWLDAFYGS